MSRSRWIVLGVITIGTVVAFGSSARPACAIQTALQPAPFTPTGRVCVKRDFGDKASTTPDPVWFTNPGAMALGSDGYFYTTSPTGGATGVGAIFRIQPSGAMDVLHSWVHFAREDGGGGPSGLVDGGDGYFYGTTYAGGHFGVGTLFRIKQGSTKPEILWHFRNGSTIGLLPDCPDPKHRCPYTPRQIADIAAAYPTTPPVVVGGIIYGVTGYSNNQQFGVLYTTSPPYDSTRFHALCIFDQRFLGVPAMREFVCRAKEVAFPTSLMRARDGMLYGTAVGGGKSTIFRATTSGTGDVTLVHEFTLDEGAGPLNLMQASNGLLYGAATSGGATGAGSIFRLEPSGVGFTVMSSFRVGTWLQGLNPFGALVELTPPGASEPYLYGTTKFGGRYGRGVIYRIPLMGDSLSLRVMHDFDMFPTGRSPLPAPVVGPDGWLYGLTYQGGKFDSGVLYALDPVMLKDVVTHDADIRGGAPATDDAKKLIQDPIVQIQQGGGAVAMALNGKDTVTSLTNGISVRAACPNPHIVQFISRTRLSPANALLAGQIESSTGSYPLTTDASNPWWHTDVPFYDPPPPSPYQRNAYLDMSPGAAHYRTPTIVTIFDRPGFGNYDDPTRAAAPSYDAKMQSTDLAKSETWSADVIDFVVCNCRVTKEVHWSRVVRGTKITFTHMSVRDAAPDALDWINTRLKRDGYAPIP